MNKLYLPSYNLDATLLGGQSFSWELIDGIYYGKTKDKVIKVKRDGENIFWQTYPKKDDFEFFKKYFRLDYDYEQVVNNISSDKFVKQGIEKNPGLRLLSQDLDDTIISFIISQNSNIPKIKKSINILSQKYGEKINIDGTDFHLFPQIEKIANAKIEDLLGSRVGYRAQYLKRSAERIVRDNLLEKIEFDENPKQKLLELHGVGDKVADCILVFSLSHDHITPLDLWAKRALTDLYKLDPKMKYEDMMKFLNQKFGNHTSFAGQFLFEYIRNL